MKTPKVFISYSHDSPAHKEWVEAFAIKLRRSGIDATLDQWDASPGDDLTLFMERGLSESDRVIVICTPNYVTKAEAGIGGVGYERMIVTSELVRNIGTNKFIPLVRDSFEESRTPSFLGTKKFVDFSEGVDVDAAFDELLRELHKAPPKRKPELGANPYALSPLGQEISRELIPDEGGEKIDVVSERPIGQEEKKRYGAHDSYSMSRTLVIADDALQWQKMSRFIAKQCAVEIVQWRAEKEAGGSRGSDQASALLDQAILCLAPQFLFSLAAVESGKQTFRDQSGLVFSLLDIRDWALSGVSWFVNLPATFVFAFQHLHGALCAHTGQFSVALSLAERKVRSVSVNEYRRICQSHDLMGWPDALSGDSLKGWGYLLKAKDWPFIPFLFEDAESYVEALIAYRILLNIHELTLLLAEGHSIDNVKLEEIHLDVPLQFAFEDRAVNKRAFQLLLQHREQLVTIWESRNVATGTIKASWPKWMEICKYWTSRSGRAFYSHGFLVHSSLFDAL